MKKLVSTTRKVEITDEMKRKVILFVRKNGSITNRQCRPLLDLGSDQVITLFRYMVNKGELVRQGKTTNIRYVLPER